jgi:hypothetical protein
MNKLNPKLEVGDRIVLISMDDPYKIPSGTVGTVMNIQNVPFSDRSDYNYRIDWDNGSKLALEPDLDVWVLKSDYDNRKDKKVDESYSIYEGLYHQHIKKIVK